MPKTHRETAQRVIESLLPSETRSEKNIEIAEPEICSEMDETDEKHSMQYSNLSSYQNIESSKEICPNGEKSQQLVSSDPQLDPKLVDES